MAAMSDYLENRIIDWLFRGQTFTPPASLHFALLTANTDDDGSPLTEVSTSGTGYARVAVASTMTNWAGTQAAGTTTTSTGTSGLTSNNNAITFGVPTANWAPSGQIVAIAIFDSASGGNMLAYSTLTQPKSVNAGDDAPRFPAGSFTFRIDD